MKGVRGYRSTMGMYLQVHRCSQTVYVSPEVVVGMGGAQRGTRLKLDHMHMHMPMETATAQPESICRSRYRFGWVWVWMGGNTELQQARTKLPASAAADQGKS